MSACGLVHRLRRVVAATERGRQELIEVLVRVSAQLRTGRAPSARCCTTDGRLGSLLEDGAEFLEQRVPPAVIVGDIDQFVLDFGQQRTILLADHPQPRRTRAVAVDPRRVGSNAMCTARAANAMAARTAAVSWNTVAPEPERRAGSPPRRVRAGSEWQSSNTSPTETNAARPTCAPGTRLRHCRSSDGCDRRCSVETCAPPRGTWSGSRARTAPARKAPFHRHAMRSPRRQRRHPMAVMARP